MSYYGISTALYNILSPLVATSPRLAAVYDTEVPSSPVYPYIVLAAGDAVEDELDTASNQTLYSYTIRAVTVAKDKDSMEDTMRQLADDVLAELRKRANQTLAGTADRFLPFTVSWGWSGEGTALPTRYWEIKMDILKDWSIDS